MQLLILILWPVLSEDAIKHVWYPMVDKSKKTRTQLLYAPAVINKKIV